MKIEKDFIDAWETAASSILEDYSMSELEQLLESEIVHPKIKISKKYEKLTTTEIVEAITEIAFNIKLLLKAHGIDEATVTQ